VKVAGDASSFQITTMHDIGNAFDPLFVSPDLYGVNGLAFAVVDDQVTPQAAIGSRGMSVQAGTKARISNDVTSILTCLKHTYIYVFFRF
jgi:hypothetical protein